MYHKENRLIPWYIIRYLHKKQKNPRVYFHLSINHSIFVATEKKHGRKIKRDKRKAGVE